ncbi:MAG: flagellar basal body-associated FliL family protein, partial [Planctomycetota bacterium]
LLLGGGGFYATYSGLLGAETPAPEGDQVATTGPETDPIEFVELDPLQVSVGGEGSIRQLRFRAYLQLGPAGADPVEVVRPRILDIFATYLRAVPVATLEDPTALLRIRSQLLRRVQLLTGPDAVEDLLIIDFVIV